MVRTFLLSCFLLLAVETNAADYPTGIASKAINALGIDLLAKAGKPDENAVLSPYSIQVAMAMICAGADGVTLAEMKKVLHYPDSEAELHQSFEALRKSLIMLERQSIAHSENPFPTGRTNDPIRLNIADRLFGQTGFRIQPELLALTREVYDAPFEQLDFRKNPLEATRRINGWVAEKTKQRILDLIPEGTLDEAIRLAIVNAIYLKAPWYTKSGCYEASAVLSGIHEHSQDSYHDRDTDYRICETRWFFADKSALCHRTPISGSAPG